MTVRKWGGEALVNTNTNGHQIDPEIVALAGGGWVTVWRDEDVTGGDGSGASIKFQRYDALGVPVGGEIVANSGAAGSQVDPSVVASGSGFLISWTDQVTQDVEYRLFDAGGNAIQADRILASVDARSQSALAALGGEFVVAFQQVGASSDIVAQKLFADGSIDGPPLIVSATANDESNPCVAAAGDFFIVGWQDSTTGQIRIRGIGTNGAEIFVAKDVSIGTDPAIIRLENKDGVLAPSNFVVAWQEDSDLHARIIFGDGTLLGSEFTVVDLNSAMSAFPALAALPTGGFVAVYTNGFSEIRGQVFDASGGRVGDEFIVTDTSSANDGPPRITTLADGRFVVTWAEAGGPPSDDSSLASVRQQVFDPRDGVVNGSSQNDNLVGHNVGSDEINGRAGNDVLQGLAGDDALYGGDGNDTLIGGPGTDELFGGRDNDTYRLDDGSDAVSDSGGIDTVTSTISRSLLAFPSIEELRLLGSASANATGNARNNFLFGNSGANTLDGLGGGDAMLGGGGNDAYIVDNTLDVINEFGGSGIDKVNASITFSLVASAWVVGSFEALTLTGGSAINGTGNSLANTILGNTAANTLNGGLGNDVIGGGAGNDILLGGAGNDIVTGGVGRDISKGDAGNDVFRFGTVTESMVGANADAITDFDDFGDDRIDFSLVFGPALTYRHNLAFTAAGQVRINDIAGADVIVEVNTGGSLAADMQIRLTGTTLASMAASDFFL